MTKYKIKPLFPDKIKTYTLKARNSKVTTESFAKVLSGDNTIPSFIDSLPDILAGKDFKTFIKKTKKAKRGKKAIIFAMGAHVIKVGLNPILIDLMESGWISALALNGAGIIHDFEIAYIGQTSEDVSAQIKDGRFGMAKETGELLNAAVTEGSKKNLGLGEAVGKMISSSDFPHKDLSLLSSAYDLSIPVTVHVALGTDIIHCHPDVDGAAVGKTSIDDFFLFCSLVERLEGGGVYVNIGSAVVLPEVFLKAVSLVRNKGKTLQKFSTAVFDFNLHYRPNENVVRRPLVNKKDGFYFIGHHEIMIPLLAASLKSASV
ncbi:MAG: hypothetical protein PVH84_07110 [Candidatus Aminicenantes bacterium]|jgi:hypothetical protein